MSHFPSASPLAELSDSGGLRMREQDPTSVQTVQTVQAWRPFPISRWRLDELDDHPSQDVSSASKGTSVTSISLRPPHTGASTSIFTPKHARVLGGPAPAIPVQTPPALLTPPSLIFPLSTDHLLHLVQYNVFRAFVSNKRTLNTLLTGWTDSPNPPSRTTCPISGPYRDDTTVYPLNPNIPVALVPTRLQQTCSHSFWINLFPFPCVRDNLIRRDGTFDHWDLLEDLIGELMGATLAQERRRVPLDITVSDPNPMGKLPLAAGHDEDEVTSGRKGLIVWGEPYDTWSWEATPAFLAKWSWAVQGCNDLLESSNRWRLMRGEEPILTKPRLT